MVPIRIVYIIMSVPAGEVAENKNNIIGVKFFVISRIIKVKG